MSEHITASARVTVTLGIDAASSWGLACTVDQIQRQAGQEAVARLCGVIGKQVKFRIIGKPVVSAVITKEAST